MVLHGVSNGTDKQSTLEDGSGGAGLDFSANLVHSVTVRGLEEARDTGDLSNDAHFFN